MSIVSNVRVARADVPSFSFGRAVALLAGTVVVGIEKVMTRAELARSRHQLAQLDELKSQLEKLRLDADYLRAR